MPILESHQLLILIELIAVLLDKICPSVELTTIK